MASTVLPNGIIIPEKFSRDWYADLYHNWQELDNLLGGGTPKDGTLTIQKNGSTVGTFSANQATDETINITVPDVNNGTLTIQQNGTDIGTFSANQSTDETINITVPDVNNGTLTIQQNGTTVDTFTANSSSDKTVNVQCVDLTSNQTVGGNKELTGTTTAHDVVPSATDTYNFGSSSYQWNNAYIKSLTINGVACGNILTHNASEFVPRSGGAVMTGEALGRIVNTNRLMIFGGTIWNSSSIRLFGPAYSDSNSKGIISLQAVGDTDTKNMVLKPDGTWTWTGTACQIISDQRLKQQIDQIDDKLLDAWEDVNLVQFKYNESVDQKGDNARLHTGYVVQQIDKACASHGVDISAYGLYCHEEYPQETEEVEIEQADGTKTKERKVIHEASEHYSLRYTEVYAVECMYLRRCIARLTARIEELEKGNNTK